MCSGRALGEPVGLVLSGARRRSPVGGRGRVGWAGRAGGPGLGLALVAEVGPVVVSVSVFVAALV